MIVWQFKVTLFLIDFYDQLCFFSFLILILYFANEIMYLTGRREEVKRAMQWLRGRHYNIEPEMAELEARVRIELSIKSNLGDLIRPWAFKPLMVFSPLL